MFFNKSSKIIFIGDSLTDAGASKNDPDELGYGYPRWIRDYLYAKYPEMKIQIINKGISGERTSDLLKRWDKDVIELAPDFLSICIGTNDVWRQFDSPEMNVIDADEYEKNLTQMISKVRAVQPSIPILLFEIPPVQPTFDTYPCSNELRTKGNELITEYNKRVYKVAAKFDTYLCPINKIFSGLMKKNPEVPYTIDGVHPNTTGIMTFTLSFCNTLNL